MRYSTLLDPNPGSLYDYQPLVMNLLTSYVWQPLTVPTPLEFPPRPIKSERWDEPGPWDYSYHNFLHYSWKQGYPYNQGIVPGAGDRDLWYLIDPALNTGCRFPIDSLIHNSSCYNEVNTYVSSDCWERPYRSRSLPQGNPFAGSLDRAKIRDPFDTGFTIWYLVRDIVEIFHTIAGIGEVLAALTALGDFAGYVNSRPRFNPKDIAAGNITYQFGITNLFRDLTDFFHVLKTWRQHYDAVIKDLHLYRKCHFIETFLDEFPYDKTFTGVATGYLNSFNVTANVKRVANVHHRTMLYRYTAPEFVESMARLRQMYDAFGIFDVSAVWDGIVPFSFILDWFFNIREWLHQNMRPRFFPADVVALDYCESFNLRYTVEWSTAWDALNQQAFTSLSDAYSPVSAPVLVEDYRRFSRRRFQPPGLSRYRFPPVSSKSSMITLRRVSIGSALAALQLTPRG